MKTNLKPSIVQLEVEVYNNLVKEVKETVATDYVKANAKKPVFAAVNLWNIQKNMKPATRYSRRSAL